MTALLGPSGSGKTTLMRAIVGVQIVHGGEVDGPPAIPAALPELRQRVAYVTHSPSVYADLTGARTSPTSRVCSASPRQRIEQVAATVDLHDQIDQVSASLSGGERARVSLAVALLARPRAAVLDEQTVGSTRL